MKDRSAKEELEQLCDLLLGSFGSVIMKPAHSGKKKVKRFMTVKAKRIVEDIEKKLWEQRYHLHRRLWVGCFPDQQGKIRQGQTSAISAERDTTLDRWVNIPYQRNPE